VRFANAARCSGSCGGAKGARARSRAVAWRLADLALVAALAGALRLAALGGMADDPFYDGAVRSMGLSWHAFLTGAIDPAATVAIDKPPGALWLQVAATKLLGFHALALHLPAAIAGCVAVLALHDALRTLFGRRAAMAGAVALAVLPVAVITARSDTMDAMVAALDAVALALVARAIRGGRAGLLAFAGLALGLTFDVKPFEGLVAAPGLALMAWLGLPCGALRRTGVIVGAGAVLVVAALAWLAALPVVGGAHLPWAYGSSDGSAWNAALVYDGLGRLGARPDVHATAAALARVPAPPGPLRLLEPQDGVLVRIGIALVAALAVAALVLALRLPRGLDRAARAGWWGLLAWLATGVVLASFQKGLRPRYVEELDPAVAAVLGAGAVLVARRHALVLAGLAAVLATSLIVSVGAVAHRVEDSGAPGALSGARLGTISSWLRARQGAARDEVASATVARGAQIVARDGRDVLLLTAGPHPLVSERQLAADVQAGQVRAALLGGECGGSGRGCSPAESWIRAHGTDVSRRLGQPEPGLVWELSAGTTTGTTRSAASRRTPRQRR
jgi:4-amino-4-deoxy-L-arabinose transferase-like glycosyltransferase